MRHSKRQPPFAVCSDRPLIHWSTLPWLDASGCVVRCRHIGSLNYGFSDAILSESLVARRTRKLSLWT